MGLDNYETALNTYKTWRRGQNSNDQGLGPGPGPGPAPEGVCFANILRDFVESEDDHSDITDTDDGKYSVRPVDILVNFDSVTGREDSQEEGSHHQIDSSVDKEDEEGEENYDSRDGLAPRERYTESDFSFLKEEWLHLTIESSENDAEDEDISDDTGNSSTN